MKEVTCSRVNCSAPLCPLQKDKLKDGIWFPDEEVCGLRKFQNTNWIKKQKLVAKAFSDKDKYFTVEMLLSTRQVRKGIEGIDPDQPLDKALAAEQKWITEKGKRVVANEKKKSGSVVANENSKLKKTSRKTRKKS